MNRGRVNLQIKLALKNYSLLELMILLNMVLIMAYSSSRIASPIREDFSFLRIFDPHTKRLEQAKPWMESNKSLDFL